ncbi:MAG TPA: PDZ domain-containing protein [Gemmatimonadaceae bacterium]|nr:PDZ domain-containing protein [Gemmatimonadaceae bacterium]
MLTVRAVIAAACIPFLESGAQGPGSRAPADTVSAPISNVAYEVTYDRRTAPSGTFGVRMTFSADAAGPVILSLPAWTPGAYEISNFARNVVGFTASSGGKDVSWDKVDFDTWRLRPAAAGPVEVRFSFVADSLDNAMSWATPDFLLFNGTNAFLYPEGRSPDFAARVVVNTESDWTIATGMTPAGRNTFTATNYHDLVDMPFFVGSFDMDSVRASDRWIRLASYPKTAVSATARTTALSQLAKLVPPQVAVFGEVPWTTYTVMQIVDSSFGGASGLEHQNSHVDILSPPFVGSEFQPSLYAHEIFHAWNVKRLRPMEMWPYVYSRPQPTPWLWVSEGITDYYADLAEVRGGVVDSAGFFRLTAAKINEVNGVIPVALEDASLSTWVHPVDGTGYIYYPKGSLAGFMLDVMIRDASDNAKSLDTVMRELYETTFRQNRGFTADDWWSAVSRAAGGKSFSDFHARYIDGREPYPWDELLPKAGLKPVWDRAPRMGVYSQQSPQGVVVTSTEPGGSADLAGVKVGDVLVSIGEIAVDDQNFGPKFRLKYANAAEGSALPIVVMRGGQRTTLDGKLMFAQTQVAIQADPAASPKAKRILQGILTGR